MSLFNTADISCLHPESTLGWTVNADGTSRVWRRCDHCGENTGGSGKWIPTCRETWHQFMSKAAS